MMKHTFTKALFAGLLILGTGWTQQAKAQLFDFSNVLQGSLNDMNKYLGAYMEPLGDGLAVGLNNGWYNTAAPHNTLGFDLTTTINMVMVPQELSTFMVSDLELQQFTTTATELPNIFGGSANGAQFVLQENVNGTDYTLATIDALSGARSIGGQIPGWQPDVKNLPVPVPTVNLGIGLIKNTDLIIRFLGTRPMPDRDFTVQMWGVGLKHDIKQWIPGMKLLPFSLSGLIGYTRTNFDVPLGQGNGSITDPRMALTGNSLTYQVLVSKKLLFFTPYAGVGVNTASSKLSMSGQYEFTTYSYDENAGMPVESVQTVDLEQELDAIGYGAGGVRATIGARIKLGILTFHGDYTINSSGYNVAAGGIGLAFR